MSENKSNQQPDYSTMPPLFRPEVLSSHGSNWMGSIRISQPLSNWAVAAFSIVIATALILFITFGNITKKAKIAGVTVPSGGSLSILTSNAGVLVQSYAVEGQKVVAGQKLFEVSTERQGNQGEITALVSQQLAIRQQSLNSERRSRLAQDIEKRHSIDGRLLNLGAEANQLEEEIRLAQKRQQLAQKSVSQFETLLKDGFVSSAQAQQKQEELIDLGARLSALFRAKVQLQANRLTTEAEQKALSSALATDMAQLQRADASLNQEIAENQNRKTSLILSPQAGIVTTLTYEPGQAVGIGQSLATLIPTSTHMASSQGNLEAHLYAPSRAIGFAKEGQTVLIRYQSYPYQKFGLQEGVIIDVSKTPFAPSELPAHLASTILSTAQQNIQGFNSNEALYRVKVKLKRQTISAYGQEQLLKPGMTLEADIVQDSRKLWEWIADPILAVAHR